MNCDDGTGVLFGELFRDCAAPIAAVRAKTFVAQPLRHETGPEITHRKCRSLFIGLIRESVARNVRDYYMKNVPCMAAECSRVREKRDQLHESVKESG